MAVSFSGNVLYYTFSRLNMSLKLLFKFGTNISNVIAALNKIQKNKQTYQQTTIQTANTVP